MCNYVKFYKKTMRLLLILKQVTTRFRQVWRSPCWSTECTAIRKSTKIRISSSRNASFRRTAPEDIRTLSFRSAPARATASAKSTECSRSKWCCPLWCATSASPARNLPTRSCRYRRLTLCSNHLSLWMSSFTSGTDTDWRNRSRFKKIKAEEALLNAENFN